MKNFSALVMSFDGETKPERGPFESIESAWQHLSDMGSKWYFYPFCFVTTESRKTIVAAPDLLKWTEGRRVASVARMFAAASILPDAQEMESDAFALLLRDLHG